MECALCGTRQPVGETCGGCGVRFGRYSCLKCNFFGECGWLGFGGRGGCGCGCVGWLVVLTHPAGAPPTPARPSSLPPPPDDNTSKKQFHCEGEPFRLSLVGVCGCGGGLGNCDSHSMQHVRCFDPSLPLHPTTHQTVASAAWGAGRTSSTAGEDGLEGDLERQGMKRARQQQKESSSSVNPAPQSPHHHNRQPHLPPKPPPPPTAPATAATASPSRSPTSASRTACTKTAPSASSTYSTACGPSPCCCAGTRSTRCAGGGCRLPAADRGAVCSAHCLRRTACVCH